MDVPVDVYLCDIHGAASKIKQLYADGRHQTATKRRNSKHL